LLDTVVPLYAIIVIVWLAMRARSRVIIESFVDYGAELGSSGTGTHGTKASTQASLTQWQTGKLNFFMT
jgi:hypothetical protein